MIILFCTSFRFLSHPHCLLSGYFKFLFNDCFGRIIQFPIKKQFECIAIMIVFAATIINSTHSLLNMLFIYQVLTLIFFFLFLLFIFNFIISILLSRFSNLRRATSFRNMFFAVINSINEFLEWFYQIFCKIKFVVIHVWRKMHIAFHWTITVQIIWMLRRN